MWAFVAIIAVVVFAAFFSALLPLSGRDRVIGEKRYENALCERTYEPLGSSKQWRDTECYPWHFYLSCHLYRVSSGDEAFAYARDGLDTTPPINGGISESVPKKWKWGFSAMAGTQLFHYDWDLSAEYQYFASSVTKTVSPLGGRTLIPLKSIALDGSRVNTAKGKNHLFLNQLDVDITKRFHFHENVLVNVGTGIRTTWLKNNNDAIYTGGPTLNTATLNVFQKNKYWGVGPLGSLRGRWLFFENFYLIAQTDASLEYTINHSRYTESQSNDTTANINIFEKSEYLAPTLSMKVGFGLADYIFCDDAHASLDLTYDTQFLWKRATSIVAEPFTTPRFSKQNGDVTLQGFALSLSILY